METKTYNVYKFRELPEEGKQKAIENLADINVDRDWWDAVYEGAREDGVEITGFDLDRGAYCTGDFIKSPLEVIDYIKKNHGKTCETYKTALEYGKLLKGKNKEKEQIEDDFRNSLLEDYRIILQHEYEYLTSPEAIIDTIDANDYNFTIDGKID